MTSETLKLPANTDAERMILGAILLSDGQLYTDARAALDPDDFFLQSNQRIFRRMGDLAKDGGLIDLVTLAELLARHDELEAVGGVTYIASLTDGTPKLKNLGPYIEIVKEHRARRALIHVGNTVADRAMQDPDVGVVAADAQRLISDVLAGQEQKGFVSFEETFRQTVPSIDEIHKFVDRAPGAQTGFLYLDRLTGGLRPADLWILAGRPSLGKTALSLNIAAKFIGRGETVGIFSLEMTTEALMRRMLCASARVDWHKWAAGFVGSEERKKLAYAAKELCAGKLYFNDQMLRHEAMLGQAKRLQAEHGLDLIIVDYLQLMESGRRHENRQQEVAGISRAMKQMARSLNVPVIAVSQLNRSPEEHGGSPRLSDLRESGQIEQDADLVLFLWRDEARGRTHPSRGPSSPVMGSNGLVKATVAKQRNGPVGTFDLLFLKQFCRFEDPAQECLPESGFYDEES